MGGFLSQQYHKGQNKAVLECFNERERERERERTA